MGRSAGPSPTSLALGPVMSTATKVPRKSGMIRRVGPIGWRSGRELVFLGGVLSLFVVLGLGCRDQHPPRSFVKVALPAPGGPKAKAVRLAADMAWSEAHAKVLEAGGGGVPVTLAVSPLIAAGWVTSGGQPT